MRKELIEKLESLKSELNNDEEVKKLNDLNDALNKNEEAMKLSYAKDMASVNFEDAIKHFGRNSNEAKDAQLKLYEANKALEENKLVKEYLQQYLIVSKIYGQINKELFDPFRK